MVRRILIEVSAIAVLFRDECSGAADDESEAEVPHGVLQDYSPFPAALPVDEGVGVFRVFVSDFYRGRDDLSHGEGERDGSAEAERDRAGALFFVCDGLGEFGSSLLWWCFVGGLLLGGRRGLGRLRLAFRVEHHEFSAGARAGCEQDGECKGGWCAHEGLHSREIVGCARENEMRYVAIVPQPGEFEVWRQYGIVSGAGTHYRIDVEK